MLRFLVPLIGFAALVGLFIVGLGKDPSTIPSPLLGRPAPAFNLPQLIDAQATFSPEQMKGQVWILNVWASWCVSCRQEHPLFVELSRKSIVPIYGLNYKDDPNDGRRWLSQLGNPYVVSVSDLSGDVGIDYGVYGVPESFVIDKEGVVRYKHVGPVTREDWKKTFEPLLKQLKG